MRAEAGTFGSEACGEDKDGASRRGGRRGLKLARKGGRGEEGGGAALTGVPGVGRLAEGKRGQVVGRRTAFWKKPSIWNVRRLENEVKKSVV